VIVALDYAEAASALALASRLAPELCRLKIGKELFTAAGPALVEDLVRRGFDIFLDLKYHDIPNTVAGACRAAAALGVWMLDVHALGGRAMLQAAHEALGASPARPRLIAVTVLTSLAQPDLDEIGIQGVPQSAAQRLAVLARGCGVDGVVCSPQEAPALRAAQGRDFLLVTPGIRMAGSVVDDQARIATPRAAIAGGASYLVVGRPVTRARDPLVALSEINREIEHTVGDGRVEGV
jgi:orotidine-5'-phosphate decarboxylase